MGQTIKQGKVRTRTQNRLFLFRSRSGLGLLSTLPGTRVSLPQQHSSSPHRTPEDRPDESPGQDTLQETRLGARHRVDEDGPHEDSQASDVQVPLQEHLDQLREPLRFDDPRAQTQGLRRIPWQVRHKRVDKVYLLEDLPRKSGDISRHDLRDKACGRRCHR